MTSRAFVDRERAAVEEDQMGAVRGASGVDLIGLDVDADAQNALGFIRRLAERIAIGAGGDADACRCLVGN